MESNLKTQLLEMGFEEGKVDLAVTAIPHKTIEAAIEWISNNEEGKENGNKENSGMEEEKGNENLMPISSHVNQELAAKLKEQGFTEAVAEKAVFLSGNASLEKALEWIESHKSDSDYLEPLMVVGQKENAPKLTPEEALAKALELQRKLRAKRVEEEKQLELERERNRIKGQKELNNAKRGLEEAQAKRDIELARQERIKDELAKEKILEDIEREKAHRFGREYIPKAKAKALNIAEPQGFDKFEVCLNQMSIAHPPDLFPGLLSTAYKTLQGAIDKIISNPGEEKFKKINTSNPNVEARLGKVFAAYESLRALGFQDENEFLVFQGNDLGMLKRASDALSKRL